MPSHTDATEIITEVREALAAMHAQCNVGITTKREQALHRLARDHHVLSRMDLMRLTHDECRAISQPCLHQLLLCVRTHWNGAGLLNPKGSRVLSDDEARRLYFTDDTRLHTAIAAQLAGRAMRPNHLWNLQRICRDIGTYEHLMTMTADDFKRLQCEKAFKKVTMLVKQAYVEEGGAMRAACRHTAPDAILQEHPILADWPNRLAVWLSKNTEDAPDREHLLTFLQKIDAFYYQSRCNQDKDRSRAALVGCCCCLFGVINKLREGRSYRTTLHFGMDESELHTFMAQMIACWLRFSHKQSLRQTVDVCQSTIVKRMVELMKTATVHAGVFPNAVTRKQTFNRQALKATMLSLSGGGESMEEDGEESDNQTTGGGLAVLQTPRVRRTATEEDVERLRHVAASDPRAQLLIALLTTTGLRAHAVATITIHHLWDRKRNRPTPQFEVIEKNSTPRIIQPCRRLREAVMVFMQSHTGRACRRFVFDRVGKGRRPLTTAGLRKWMKDLCRRAGIPYVIPHGFRAYIITHLRSLGVPAEMVCKFVGHKSDQTQNAHYWKEDVEAIARSALLQPGSDGSVRGLMRCLHTARGRLDALRSERDCLHSRLGLPDGVTTMTTQTKPSEMGGSTGFDALMRQLAV